MAVMIHNVHRELAKIVQMITDKNGNLIVGQPELALILPLLKQNYELVYEIDGLKEIAFTGQMLDQMDLVQHVCERLEELEVQCT
ncbi:DUF7667 family protein [Paenibacillus hubeiensis]|uniref:DUF7667 family protein n=1 Tax=Paenibacillus hubeiensis TaxID=3077330 RepID=UPI0031BAEBD6